MRSFKKLRTSQLGDSALKRGFHSVPTERGAILQDVFSTLARDSVCSPAGTLNLSTVC